MYTVIDLSFGRSAAAIVTDPEDGSNLLFCRKSVAQLEADLCQIATVVSLDEEGDDEPMEFLWVDKSGRGMTNDFSESGLLKAFHEEEIDEEEQSDNGERVAEWVDNTPAIGEVWENAANRITRTK